MPEAPLPPLPPADRPRWRAGVDELQARLQARPAAAAALIASVAAVLVVAGTVLLLRPARPVPPPPLPMAAPAPAEPAEPGDESRGAPPGQPEEVVVDVAGAVARPGLVRLRSGSRVADALAAAGGPGADAVLAGVNQARVLTDGEQVRVPRIGEPAPPPTAVSPAPGAPPGGVQVRAAPVDLNLATVADLDTLPGVGPATAAAIVAWRDENGGFRRVDDLLEVPGIGPARLERLRPHVSV